MLWCMQCLARACSAVCRSATHAWPSLAHAHHAVPSFLCPPPPAQHPAAAAQALSREGAAELLLAAVHMGLDPAANLLHEELAAGGWAGRDARLAERSRGESQRVCEGRRPQRGSECQGPARLPACRRLPPTPAPRLSSLPVCLPPPHRRAAVEALLGAFDESDWERKLPQLADRLADMGPSRSARLKVCSTFCRRRRCSALRHADASNCLPPSCPLPPLPPRAAAAPPAGRAPARPAAAAVWRGRAAGAPAAGRPRGGQVGGASPRALDAGPRCSHRGAAVVHGWQGPGGGGDHSGEAGWPRVEALGRPASLLCCCHAGRCGRKICADPACTLAAPPLVRRCPAAATRLGRWSSCSGRATSCCGPTCCATRQVKGPHLMMMSWGRAHGQAGSSQSHASAPGPSPDLART